MVQLPDLNCAKDDAAVTLTEFVDDGHFSILSNHFDEIAAYLRTRN